MPLRALPPEFLDRCKAHLPGCGGALLGAIIVPVLAVNAGGGKRLPAVWQKAIGWSTSLKIPRWLPVGLNLNRHQVLSNDTNGPPPLYRPLIWLVVRTSPRHDGNRIAGTGASRQSARGENPARACRPKFEDRARFDTRTAFGASNLLDRRPGSACGGAN